ncbi:MAG: hypothetical protein Q7U99_08860 [Rubrivivax sp.]|nr:hypothetical protein [Rubrivivax sp.]
MVPTLTQRRWPCALPSLLFTLLLAAQAQAQSPTPARPDPTDPKAQVPAVRYESAFAQFRRSGDDKPVAWREANDAVARIGGWRVYTRQAQQPDPAAAEKPAVPAPVPAQTPAPAPAAKPMPPGHSGHKH